MDKPRYISEIIGEEYEGWGETDIIFITAPTGSGKSHFILYDFLKWAVINRRKMLYLVNRKILMNQIEEELEEVRDEFYKSGLPIGINLKEYVTVMTYQSIENAFKKENSSSMQEPSRSLSFIDVFDCVVCDECHYFYADSNFNTSSELSYFMIRKMFENKLQIYISATPNQILENMERYLNDMHEKIIKGEMLPSSALNVERHPYKERLKQYSIESDYNYINLSIFKNIDDLVDIIKRNVIETGEKWLVFVDKIDLGRGIQKELYKKSSEKVQINKEDVVFLDAEYGMNEDARDSVTEISKRKYSSKKVVISTAVMDNGVSLHDANLKNIVILADTQEEFIQMLGRKRKDDEKVKLYICKRNVDHFTRRANYMTNIIRWLGEYEKDLNFLFSPFVSEGNFTQLEKTSYHYVDYMWKRYEEVTQGNCVSPMLKSSFILHPSFFSHQQRILDELLSNKETSKYVKKLCYSAGGLLILNGFSMKRLHDMKIFYKDMVSKLEKDEYAFVYQQQEWLGLSNETIKTAIWNSEKGLDEIYEKVLDDSIKEIIAENKEGITKEKNIEWKISVREQIIHFSRKSENFTDVDERNIRKNDRPLSENRFNLCMEQAGLPYIMERKTSNYIIRAVK